MKKLGILILIIFCSCQKQTIDFTIKNESEINFDSAVITGLGKSTIINLKSKSNVNVLHDYSNSESRTDGAYQLKLYGNNYNKEHVFGYYSNGSPSSKKCDITIKNDTILFNETFN